jgi:chromosome segregation ATPase
MGEVQAIKNTIAVRTAEREELAAAIDRRKEAADRLARIKSAAEVLFVADALETVEKAEEVVAKARKFEARRAVAELIGDQALPGLSLERADWMLEEAREELDRAKRAREAIDSQQRDAELALDWAENLVREAANRVVQADEASKTLVALYLEARREVERLEGSIQLLTARGCVPRYVTAIQPHTQPKPDHPWRSAFDALERDPDAALPA